MATLRICSGNAIAVTLQPQTLPAATVKIVALHSAQQVNTYGNHTLAPRDAVSALTTSPPIGRPTNTRTR